MSDYVLDLGFVAFYDWWTVMIALIFFVLYMIANVIPACFVLFCGLKEGDIWYTPMVFIILLIPFIGSLFGLNIMWDESERMVKFITLLLYGLIICMIGGVWTSSTL